MKVTKKLTALALCIVMMAASAGLVLANTPSDWAVDQVNTAIARNLVPHNLRSNYTQPITRAEFCALAVALYEAMGGQIAGRVSFTDTNDLNVEKMAYLGVVSGVAEGEFDPNGTLTREQAAVILSRLSDVLGWPFPSLRTAAPLYFADRESIAPWAQESVFRVYMARVMSGVGDSLFAPQQSFTREQSIITINRMFENMNLDGILGGPPLTPPDNLNNNETVPFEPQEADYVTGTVVVVSGGVEYQAIEHFDHGAISGGEFALMISGTAFPYQVIWDSLTEIVYSDNFEVQVRGNYATRISVSLYNERFEEIYSGASSFRLPEGAGLYLLTVSVSWRNEETLTEDFTAIRYAFKVRMN